MNRVCCCLCFLILFAGWMLGQMPPQNLRVSSIWMDHYPVVNVDVECIPTAPGSACTIPNDVAIQEDGGTLVASTEQNLLSEKKLGTALVVAIDASGSMHGWPISAIRKALTNNSGKSKPEDRIALLSFADEARTESPFGGDRAAWPNLINALQTRCCNTHLYDAVVESSQLMEKSDLPPIRRILVISDGKDEGSRSSIETAISRANSGRSVVDAIGVSRIQTVYLDSLKRIAAETGGMFRQAHSDQELEALIGLGIQQMAAGKVFSYRLAKTQADGNEHSFTVGRPGFEWKVARFLHMPLERSTKQTSPPPPYRLFISFGIALALLAILMVFILLKRRRNISDAIPFAQASGSQAFGLGEDRQPSVSEISELEPEPKVHEIEVAASRPEVRKQRRRTVILHRFSEPSLASPSAWLSQLSGDENQENLVYALIRTKTWFGSDPSATIQLAASSEILPLHACLEFDDGSFYLSSESAAALVALQGERFSSARRIVMPGDELRIGNAVFRLAVVKPQIV